MTRGISEILSPKKKRKLEIPAAVLADVLQPGEEGEIAIEVESSGHESCTLKIPITLAVGSSTATASSGGTSAKAHGQTIGANPKPVGSSEKVEILEVDKNLQIALPESATAGGNKLTAKLLAAPPPLPSGLAEAGPAYEITFSGQIDSRKPSALIFSYDPAVLKGDPELEKNLVGAYWDDKIRDWLPAPTVVNLKTHQAMVLTRHFSIWRLIYFLKGKSVHDTPHFRIVYSKDPGAVFTIGDAGSDNSNRSQSEMALSIGNFLEHAYQRYGQAGFAPPESSIRTLMEEFVRVTSIDWTDVTPLKIWVFLGWSANLLDADEVQQVNYRSGCTGAIFLASDYDNLDDVRHTCSHELFHSIQNEYCNIFALGWIRWWIEATADYAAQFIAWDGAIDTMGKNFRADYFSLPIWVAETQEHEYKTSHFIDYILSHDNGQATFLGMWEATMAWRAGFRALTPLDDYVTQTTGITLGNFFRGFTPDLTAEVFLLKGGTAFRKIDTGGAGTIDGIFSRGFLKKAKDSVVVQMTDKDHLFVLTTNTSVETDQNAKSLVVKISEPQIALALEAIPEPKMPRQFTCRATASEIPPEVKKVEFLFEFNDGSTSFPEKYPKPVESTLVFSQKHSFASDDNRTISVEVIDRTTGFEVSLGKAECEITFPPRLRLVPSQAYGEPGKPIEVGVEVSNGPLRPLFRWKVEGESSVQETSATSIKRTFSQEKRYSVQVQMVDPARPSEIVAQAAGSIVIETVEKTCDCPTPYCPHRRIGNIPTVKSGPPHPPPPPVIPDSSSGR